MQTHKCARVYAMSTYLYIAYMTECLLWTSMGWSVKSAGGSRVPYLSAEYIKWSTVEGCSQHPGSTTLRLGTMAHTPHLPASSSPGFPHSLPLPFLDPVQVPST